MGPKPVDECSDHDLFRAKYLNLINLRYELVRLDSLIGWRAFESKWSPHFISPIGRPAQPIRLMASLLYLKHVYVER